MSADVNNLVEMLDTSAKKYPGKVALVFGTKRITYKELVVITRKLAGGLSELGVRRGDRVGIWFPNCPEFVYSFFAILRLGAVVVPINSMFKREEGYFIMEDSAAKVLLCSIDRIADAQNLLSRLDDLGHVICVSAPKDDEVIVNFDSFLNRYEEFDKDTKIEEDELAQIIYTSGTTGRPKGASLTHKNLLANVKDCAQIINVTRRDCTICILPLFHSFASTVCMLLPIYKGARVVIMRAVRPFKRVIRSIFKQKVTIFAGVPSLYSILAEAKFSSFALFLNRFINPLRLCISGAAALPFDVWEKFEKKFKRPLLQGYGLTEASPVVSLNPYKGRKKPASVGIALPSVEVKVVDKSGEELSCGDIGELLVKGPNVMKGYYNLDKETHETLKESWLYTGDLAKMDEDGFIYIMGRSKEMINVRGLNVYPREIEDLLYKHPMITEAAIVGVEHPHRGEVPVAFVVNKADIKEREIVNYLRVNLASYKVPIRIFFKDNLPKNTTGKILKKDLRKEVEHVFK